VLKYRGGKIEKSIQRADIYRVLTNHVILNLKYLIFLVYIKKVN